MTTIDLIWYNDALDEITGTFTLKDPQLRNIIKAREAFDLPLPDDIWDEVKKEMAETSEEGLTEDSNKSASGKMYARILKITFPREKYKHLDLVLDGDLSQVNFATLTNETAWGAVANFIWQRYGRAIRRIVSMMNTV